MNVLHWSGPFSRSLAMAMLMLLSLALLGAMAACGGGDDTSTSTPRPEPEETRDRDSDRDSEREDGEAQDEDEAQEDGEAQDEDEPEEQEDEEEPESTRQGVLGSVGNQANEEPENETGTSSVLELDDLEPDVILRMLPKEEATDTLRMYVNVQQAIKALDARKEVLTELADQWRLTELSVGFGIDVADLNHFAFGEAGGSDSDVILISGADLDDLRDTLGDLAFEKFESRGMEVWMEGDDSENETDWESFAFLGEIVLITNEGYEKPGRIMEISLGRLAGDFEVLAELLPRLAKSEVEVDEDVLRLFKDNPGMIRSVLLLEGGSSSLSRSYFNGDLYDTFIDEVRKRTETDSGGTEDDYGPYPDRWWSFSEWLSGKESGALETFLRSVAQEVAENEYFREVIIEENRTLLHSDGGRLWTALPDGIGKQMGGNRCEEVRDAYSRDFDCVTFAHSLDIESDQQFRLTGILEFESAGDAAAEFEDTDEDDIDRACVATFELDGSRIHFVAVCDMEALIRITDIS